MLLMCMVNAGHIGGDFFIKDVPVRVLHITEDKKALVEYDFKAAKTIKWVGTEDKVKELVDLKSLTAPDYMACKRKE